MYFLGVHLAFPGLAYQENNRSAEQSNSRTPLP